MKKSQANKLFIELYGNEDNLQTALKKDYLAVQYEWSIFIDNLCRNGDITMQQYESWIFPWAREGRNLYGRM